MKKKPDDAYTWNGQDMRHLTFNKGEILVATDNSGYVEVVDVLVPWRPNGPTWQSKLLLIKVANRNGSLIKQKKPAFEAWCMGYTKVTTDTLDWKLKEYQEALDKATKDLDAYKDFASRVARKIVPFETL